MIKLTRDDHQIVWDPKRRLALRLLWSFKGLHGESRYMVQKLSALGLNGMFSVRPFEVSDAIPPDGAEQIRRVYDCER